MVAGPASLSAVVASASLGVGSLSYWAQQALHAYSATCPDCHCQCLCSLPSAGPELAELSCPEESEITVSLAGLLARHPEEGAKFAFLIFFIVVVAFVGGRKSAAHGQEPVPFISEPIYEIPVTRASLRHGDRGLHSPARRPRAITPGMGRGQEVLDPIPW